MSKAKTAITNLANHKAKNTEKKATTTTKKATTTTKAAPVEADAELMAQIMMQSQGRFFGPPADISEYKSSNLVTAKNGVFTVRKTPIALFVTETVKFDKKDYINGLPEMEAGPQLLIPKIPFKYHQMVLAFYREVHDKDKTEASVLFFWNHNNISLPKTYENGQPINGLIEDGQLIIYCPTQVNSSTLSDFTSDGMVNYLRQYCAPLMETHSHHTMDAFWSGTDNANENYTQFYGVWGKIKDDNPKFLFRWVCGNDKVDIDESVLIDIPPIVTTVTTKTMFPGGIMEPVETTETKLENFRGPWPVVEFPSDWYAQHEKEVYVAPKSYGSKKSYGNYGSYGGYGGTYSGHQTTFDEHLSDEELLGFYEGYDGIVDNPTFDNYSDESFYEESKKKAQYTLKINAYAQENVKIDEDDKEVVACIVQALADSGIEDDIVEDILMEQI